MSLIIGSHVSFTNKEQLVGSVNESIGYGSNTFMFYTGGPQSTVRSEINDDLTYEAFKLMLEKNRINATIRRGMGKDIDAACGQLRRSYTTNT